MLCAALAGSCEEGLHCACAALTRSCDEARRPHALCCAVTVLRWLGVASLRRWGSLMLCAVLRVAALCFKLHCAASDSESRGGAALCLRCTDSEL